MPIHKVASLEPGYGYVEQFRGEILQLELLPGLSIGLAIDQLCAYYTGTDGLENEGVAAIQQALLKLGLVPFLASVDSLADRELFLRLAWPARLQRHHPTLAVYWPWAHVGLVI